MDVIIEHLYQYDEMKAKRSSLGPLQTKANGCLVNGV